eukprot:1148937-Pelagomonas_calceolata.AAC.6
MACHAKKALPGSKHCFKASLGLVLGNVFQDRATNKCFLDLSIETSLGLVLGNVFQDRATNKCFLGISIEASLGLVLGNVFQDRGHAMSHGDCRCLAECI